MNTALKWTCLLLAPAFTTWAWAAEPASTNWPQFRGPNASGIAGGEKLPPTSWDVEQATNIRWTIDVPGLGHSCPVIWGDRLYLTTAVSDWEQTLRAGLYGNPGAAEDKGALRWQVLCYDKHTGKLLWERTVHEGLPQAKRHTKATHANPTCCTDGKRVIAFFGSEGLFCFDMDGKPLWNKSFGLLDAGAPDRSDYPWGFASSPVLYEDKLVVLADVMQHQKKSFLKLLDASTGKEIWTTPRNDVSTWGTPTVWRDPDGAGQTYLFVNGYQQAAGYDFATGNQLWTLGNNGDIPVPTPVVAHGLVFLTSGHGAQSPVVAVKPQARGDLTPKKNEAPPPGIAWQVRLGGNYMQTPLVVGERLFCCRDNGTLTCYEAKTGKQLYRQRIEGLGFTASGVAAADQLYFTSEDGRVQVIRAADTYQPIASNELGDASLAAPAISDGVIYFRTQRHLIAVGSTPVADQGNVTRSGEKTR